VEALGISRADQDAFACESQRRAAAAIALEISAMRSFQSKSRREKER